jgi:hypothetical protein
MAWVGRKKNRDTIDKLFSKKRKLGLFGAPKQRKLLGMELPYQSEIRLEHFEELFATSQLDQTLIPPLIEYLKHYFPGKRGTNHYTDKQLAVYTRIKDALEAGKVVAAGTPDIVGRTSEGEGHSAGESKSKGLVGGHAFSVLSVTTVGERYFVEVRNPWGVYGRGYDEQDDGRLKTNVKEDDGTSMLELSDLTKRFDLLYVA